MKKLSREEKNLKNNIHKRAWSHAKWLYHISKARARRKGTEWDLQITDIIVPCKCPVLGVKLKRNVGCGGSDSATIDRINPRKGYVKNNIAVISALANRIKSNATHEEIEKTFKWLKKYENNNKNNKKPNTSRKRPNR